MPQNERQSNDHRNNFNLLRLTFASLVLLSHAPQLIDGNNSREILMRWTSDTLSLGSLAVDGFFLLSGFLILQSWHRKPHFGDFLKKRVLRVYPGFVVASLISIFMVGPLGSPSSALYFQKLHLWKAIAAMFYLLVPRTPLVFPGHPQPITNGSLWTIQYEFRCYLIVALLGACALLKRRLVWPALTGTALVLYIFPAALSRIMEFVVGNIMSTFAMLFDWLPNMNLLMADPATGAKF